MKLPVPQPDAQVRSRRLRQVQQQRRLERRPPQHSTRILAFHVRGKRPITRRVRHSRCFFFFVVIFVLFVPVGCAQLLSSIAGVGDLYTDPQIHTIDGRGMGLGNNGSKGIQRWVASHRCNAICRQLKLPQVGADAKPGTDHYTRALNNTGFTSFCFVQTCLALSPDSLRW